MSSSSHVDTPTLPFQAIFNTALIEYSQKTGKNIVTDPLTAKLRCCSTPDAVLNVLQEEAQAFNDFRNGNRKVQLMRKLKPTVDILLALSTSGVLDNGVGLVSAQPRDNSLPAYFISLPIGISACQCDFFWNWPLTCSASSLLPFRV
jgi:hypothetical protein